MRRMAFDRPRWMRSSLCALAICLGLLGLFVAPAQSQTQASMVIEPATAPQNTTITMSLTGFRANELVNIWQTFPDGQTTVELGNVTVDGLGRANVGIFVGANNPVGIHVFGARGTESLRRASATLELTLGAGSAPDNTVQIEVQQEATRTGNTLVFNGSGYRANERVSLWINLPDNGAVRDLGHTFSNGSGAFEFRIFLDFSYPVGTYQFTAFGNRSNLTGVALFDLVRIAEEQLETAIFVAPNEARQGEMVVVEGQNFGSEETVSIWITAENPEDGLVELTPVTTFEDGFFAFELTLRNIPPGTHFITAQGRESGRVAINTFTVLP